MNKKKRKYSEFAAHGKHSRGKRGKRAGVIVTGTYRGTGKGYAFLTPDDGGEDLFIPGFALGGALNGDKVSAEVFTEGGKSEAHVLEVLQQTTVYVVGTYAVGNSGSEVIVPDDGKTCKLFVIESIADGCRKPKEGSKVVGLPLERDGDILYGELVEVIGDPGAKNTDLLSVARTFGLDDRFPPEVQAAVHRVPMTLSKKEISGREDFRGDPIVTVDAPDAKDLDDAICVKRRGNEYVLYVHIADVSYYVKERSPIDREALKRGTSVYFPGCVFPMLPTELSNGICSLNPGQDRLTLSCVINIDKRGRMSASRIVKGVIKTIKRMDYDTVAAIVEGDEKAREENADVCEMLDTAKELADILHGLRMRKGSIEFDIPEPKLTLDENGVCTNVELYEHKVSHMMIEEFMLAANETVAETFDSLKVPFVYRVHEAPPEDKRSAFIDYLATLGLKFDGKEPHEYADLLEKVKGTPDERAVSRTALRAMSKAKYSTKDLGHFGLALKHYCHFTSPIRRYPDLQDHRLITEFIARSGKGMKRYGPIAEEAASRSSAREQIALSAERRITDIKKAEFMKAHIGEEFEGNVSSVTEWGAFVELPNCVEGLIRKESMGADPVYDEKRRIIMCEGEMWNIGKPVRVVCFAVENGKVDFVPAARKNDTAAEEKGGEELPAEKKPRAKKRADKTE